MACKLIISQSPWLQIQTVTNYKLSLPFTSNSRISFCRKKDFSQEKYWHLVFLFHCRMFTMTECSSHLVVILGHSKTARSLFNSTTQDTFEITDCACSSMVIYESHIVNGLMLMISLSVVQGESAWSVSGRSWVPILSGYLTHVGQIICLTHTWFCLFTCILFPHLISHFIFLFFFKELLFVIFGQDLDKFWARWLLLQ